MSKNNTDVKALDELNKGATMGMDAIEFIIPKVKDLKLKKELKSQYEAYDEMTKKISKIYPLKDKKPHETSQLNQTMTWMMLEKCTLMDSSTSKLAELLIQGVNMGIIEGRRLLNHKGNDEQVNALLDEYVNMQEDALDNLKNYL